MLVFMTSAVQPKLASQTPRFSSQVVQSSGRAARPVPDRVSLSEKPVGLNASRQNHDALNAAAGQIRYQDAGLQTVVRYARQMAHDIRVFKKNFPPFPAGSEERERLLNSFSAIRKQIARLTIPPETGEAAANSEQGAANEGSPASMSGAFERLFAAIWERVPAVPADASDSAFDALIKKLESLLEFIQKNRAGIQQQAFSEHDVAREASIEMAAISIHIGSLFSEQSAWQMTVSQAQLKAF